MRTVRGQPRRHRAFGRQPGFWRRPAGREVLESLLALAVVAALVGVLLGAFGGSANQQGAPAAGRTPTAATAPSTGPVGTPEASAPAGPMTPVLVLNNSRITGLAARAAASFRAGGWPVRGTGNYRGRIPVTTIYYGPGELPVAQRFAARFPAVRRVLPRPAGLPGSGLTVVVTREFRA